MAKEEARRMSETVVPCLQNDAHKIGALETRLDRSKAPRRVVGGDLHRGELQLPGASVEPHRRGRAEEVQSQATTSEG